MMVRKFPELQSMFVADLERQGATVLLNTTTRSRPATMSVSFGEHRGSFDFYAWNVTPGGGSGGERPATERRIQLTGVENFPTLVGRKGLLMGWSEEYGVWVAWDISRHKVFSTKSPSLQVNSSTLEKAFQAGIASQKRPSRQGEEIVIALHSDFLAWYLFEGIPIHHFGEEAEDVSEFIENSPEEWREFVDSAETDASISRRSELITVLRKYRDAKFRPQVLRAYSYRCAVCQVALRMVDAAHIVPVSEPESTDDPDNGLALCALHHRAYDSGLLVIRPNYQVSVCRETEERLTRSNLNSGIDDFTNRLPNRITLPITVEVRPKPNLLKKGMEVRGVS